MKRFEGSIVGMPNLGCGIGELQSQLYSIRHSSSDLITESSRQASFADTNGLNCYTPLI